MLTNYCSKRFATIYEEYKSISQSIEQHQQQCTYSKSNSQHCCSMHDFETTWDRLSEYFYMLHLRAAMSKRVIFQTCCNSVNMRMHIIPTLK